MKNIDFDELFSRLLMSLVLALGTVVLIILIRLLNGWSPLASHTMQPDCRDANVPYTMQRDPAHEAPREYPEPPR